MTTEQPATADEEIHSYWMEVVCFRKKLWYCSTSLKHGLKLGLVSVEEIYFEKKNKKKWVGPTNFLSMLEI